MTGKTRNLAAIFAQAAARHGSQRCAAVTYTRAAGLELKNRLAPVLGISPASVKTQLPYVGTIHSLAYQALNCPTLVDKKAFESFCHDVHMEAPQRSGWEDRVDDLEALPSLEVKEQEAEAFRMLLSSARHRMISLTEMVAIWLDGMGMDVQDRLELTDIGRVEWLATRYKGWKLQNHLMDYEDLLEEGGRSVPPVKFLICDEVQDNSPLMWSVVDAWGSHCEQMILAGDPYQSIYLFSGADPRLFMNHPGEKVLLKESHRLTNESVGFATAILERAGWADEGEVIGQWYGQDEPKGMDGSTFFLARTHRLLSPIRHQLMEEGEPFVELRGTAPWESIAGQAYRALTSLMAGNTQPRAYLAPIAKALKRRGKLPISARAADAITRERSMDPVWIDDARAAFGGADLSNLREMLEHYEYLHRVEVKHGIEGLWFPPSISIGTIHGSKGREADVVNLVKSWAHRPAASLEEDEGRRAEALVAYVGATRHRTTLNLLDADEGIDYDWPSRRSSASR